MSRAHGKEVRVYLGGRDASGDISNVNAKATAAVHDVSNFGGQGWSESDPGALKIEVTLQAFHDPETIEPQLEPGAFLVLSVYDSDADAIGETGMVFPACPLTTREQPMSVTEMVKLNGTLSGNGKPGLFAKLLHPLGQETEAGDGASLNNGASSANGGRGNLHVTAITGTWTIKIQHSANDSDWEDLLAFTQVTEAGGPMAESVEVSGTVNQHLRWTVAEDVAGSVTFVTGFARY